MITFYRGLWCPYCNTDLAYIGGKRTISSLGATLIGISPQTASYSQQIRQKNNLIPILADKGR